MFRSHMPWLAVVAVMSIAACAVETEEEPPRSDESDDDTNTAAGTSFQPGCQKLATPAPYALGGTILTPNGPVEGYVVVRDEKIEKVAASRAEIPADVKNVIDTEGVVSPGLIDLHNHVAYNYLPLWQTNKRFTNRYQWARLSEYDRVVKDPYNAVKNARHQCQQVKYGEMRAIVGGTTTIQGSVDSACTRSWVRNVEYTNFCEDHIRQNVLPINGIKPADAATLNAGFASGKTRAFFVHLAEGTDDASRKEFEDLRKLDLLKPQVVGIHSTALTEAQLQEMGRIGMKIVWSPLSNLLLYGQTTNIPVAVKAGVKVALAPDWTPSGSANALGELKVADRVNRERFAGLLSDRDLVDMVTSNAADIAGMDKTIGRIESGKYADLLVVRGDRRKPYRAVIAARPQDVLLTTVSGDAFFGAESTLAAIGAARSYETVDACGEPRKLSVVEKDTRIPGGHEALGDLRRTFSTDGVKDIIPLFDCGPMPEAAFKP